MNNILPVCLALTIAGALSAQAGESTGGIRPPADTKADLVVRALQHQVIDLGGQTVEAGQELEYELHIKISDVEPDGTFSLSARINCIRGHLDIPDVGRLAFQAGETQVAQPQPESAPPTSVEGPEEDVPFGVPTAAMIRSYLTPLCGREFVARVGTRRAVEQVVGLDAAAEEARLAVGLDNGEMLSGVVDADGIRSMIRAVLGPIPRIPLDVGATWQQDEVDVGRSPMRQLSTYVIGSVSPADYKFDASGKLEPPTDEEIAAMPLTEEQREVVRATRFHRGKVSHSGTVDRKTGLILQSRSQFTMAVTIPGQGGMETSAKVTNEICVARKPAAGSTPSGNK